MTATVLKYLMSKLTPADLEELDQMLEDGGEPMATDHRLPDRVRSKWLGMSPEVRNASRAAA